MAIDTAPLERLGIHVSPSELEQRLSSALKDVLPPWVVSQPEGELNSAEVTALTRGGLDLRMQGARDSESGAGSPLLRGATEYAAIVASSYTVAEAARRLGVDGSRVRQRLGARTLYGVKHGGSWLLPAFQFAADGVMPNLAKVLPALDPDLSPVTVARWLRTPNPDLVRGAEEAMHSPLDWLEAGHSPDRVAGLARELGSGF